MGRNLRERLKQNYRKRLRGLGKIDTRSIGRVWLDRSRRGTPRDNNVGRIPAVSFR